MSLMLKKHVGLIHISGTLSVLQHKVVNVLHLHAYDHLLTQRVHEIPISALAALAGFNSRDIQHLADTVAAIQTTLVRFAVLEPSGMLISPEGTKRSKRGGVSPFIGQGTLLAWAEFQDGVCRYSYIEQMAEQMYNPAIYASIDVGLNRDISSGFAIRLYENTVRYRNIGCTSRDPHYWSLEVFRELMGATSQTYDEFRRLRVKVIEPAVREVNALSDILLEPEYRHSSIRGRPVTGIRFKIRDNPQRALLPMEGPEAVGFRNADPVKRLIALGVSERLAMMAFQKDPKWALAIAMTVESKRTAGYIKQSTAAYASALINRHATVALPERVGGSPELPDAASLRDQAERAKRDDADHSRQVAKATEALGQDGVTRFRDEYLAKLAKRNQPDAKSWDDARGMWIGEFPRFRFEQALIKHAQSKVA